jgi:hypothetical protein
MKKEKFVLLLAVSFMFLIILVNAYSPIGNEPIPSSQSSSSSAIQPNRIITDMITGLQSAFGPIFSTLLGEDGSDGNLLFSKILIFILLFSVVFIVLSRVDLFGGKRGIVFVVASIVAILAVRYLKASELITAILMPYGAMGAAITVFLPFLIFFFFVYDAVPGTFGRRAAWAVFGLFFLAFLLYNSVTGDTGAYVGYSWIYWMGLILIFLCFIFDKTIKSYFQYSDFEKAKNTIDQRARLQMLEDLHKAKEYGTPKDVRNVEKRARQAGYDIGF